MTDTAAIDLLEFVQAFKLEIDATSQDIHPSARAIIHEMLFGAAKKSGKSGFAALFMITLILLFGPRYAEGYCVANDLDQAQGRVFEACRRIIEASPLLRSEAKITADRITLEATGATVIALSGNYASAAACSTKPGHMLVSALAACMMS
jgi:phage terminase large subunit-like protein